MGIRLYFDCGWNNKSSFRCGICDEYRTLYLEQPTEQNKMDYRAAFPLIKQHIIEEHPEQCYMCAKCKSFCVSKKELKSCCK